jgi:hypothetical protein
MGSDTAWPERRFKAKQSSKEELMIEPGSVLSMLLRTSLGWFHDSSAQEIVVGKTFKNGNQRMALDWRFDDSLTELVINDRSI